MNSPGLKTLHPWCWCTAFRSLHGEFRPISNAGHIPHYELPEVANPLLLELLG